MSPQLPLHSKPLGGKPERRKGVAGTGAKWEAKTKGLWPKFVCQPWAENMTKTILARLYTLFYFSVATATPAPATPALAFVIFLFEPVWEMWTIYNRNCCVCIWLTRRIRNQRAIAKSIEGNNIASGIFCRQVIWRYNRRCFVPHRIYTTN